MEIQLIKWTEENKNDLIHLCNEVDRKYVSNRMPYPYTEECADWWYENVVCQDGKTGVFRAISVDGIIAGNISVEPKEDIFCKDTEIGYLLKNEFHSKGIATQAVKQICELAFAQLDIERITGCVFSPNIASQKVLLKNGFKLEGIKKSGVYKDGVFYDLHIYGKYRKEEQ